MRDDTGLYDPRPVEDEEEDPPPGGYRIRSDDTWALARDAYLAGGTAEAVCARFDLGLSTFRERARKGGWRRCDRGDPEPLPVGPEDDVDFDAGYAELSEYAMRQLRRAMARGRASAAASWMRLHERLMARAKDQAEAERKAAADAAARRRAETRATVDGIDALARGVETLARRIAATDPRDSVARAAIDAELARLDVGVRGDAMIRRAPIPDDPDDPDAFFSDGVGSGPP